MSRVNEQRVTTQENASFQDNDRHLIHHHRPAEIIDYIHKVILTKVKGLKGNDNKLDL